MCPSVTINSHGIAVVWTSQNQDGNWDLFGRWFDDAGNAVRSEFQINSTSSSAAMQSQVGMDPWGYVMVVWQSEVSGQQDIYGRYGSFCNYDGWDTGEFVVNQTTQGNQYNPSLGFKSNDGSFVVSWTSDLEDGSAPSILAQRFDTCAGRIGSEFQVPAPSTTVYTVAGGGSDIWGSSDQFNFASESISGNAEIIAKVDSLDNTAYWAKAGLMFRDSLNPDSMHALIYVNPENLVVFQWRTADGAWTADHYSDGPVNGTVWLKLVRDGNEFSGYYSTDGTTWTQVGTTMQIQMGATIQAGLAVSANNNGSLCTAQFSDVTINGTNSFALADADVGSPGVAGSYSVGESIAPSSGYLDNSSVTVDENTGDFLITWSSQNPDSQDSGDVYSQLYTADGTTYGPRSA